MFKSSLASFLSFSFCCAVCLTPRFMIPFYSKYQLSCYLLNVFKSPLNRKCFICFWFTFGLNPYYCRVSIDHYPCLFICFVWIPFLLLIQKSTFIFLCCWFVIVVIWSKWLNLIWYYVHEMYIWYLITIVIFFLFFLESEMLQLSLHSAVSAYAYLKRI